MSKKDRKLKKQNARTMRKVAKYYRKKIKTPKPYQNNRGRAIMRARGVYLPLNWYIFHF